MWVFTRSSFLSLIADPNDPAMLTVRARMRGDIQRLWPDATVMTTPLRDYRYRASIPREIVAAALTAEIVQFTYGNFKASVSDPGRAHWYGWVWRTTSERCPERA